MRKLHLGKMILRVPSFGTLKSRQYANSGVCVTSGLGGQRVRRSWNWTTKGPDSVASVAPGCGASMASIRNGVRLPEVTRTAFPARCGIIDPPIDLLVKEPHWIGRIVKSANGPEGGVWVIAETKDLGT